MQNQFKYNPDTQNFSNNGVDVIVFGDDYACGHQSGINLIMHDKRMANGGDIRFEQTPGQWQPVPVRLKRVIDEEHNSIIANMHYPDTNAHLKGFNPAIYPDVELDYHINVTPADEGIDISVIVDNPIPACLSGKACFNLELVPVHVVGRPWIMDEESGIFPTQPNGPTIEKPANINIAGVYQNPDGLADINNLLGNREEYNPIVADNIIAMPYATGHCFTALPDDDLYRFTVISKEVPIKLYDGRLNHNNGWFVLSSELPCEKAGELLKWTLKPSVIDNWYYTPVVQVSQVGYHPNQQKVAVLEADKKSDLSCTPALLYEITNLGPQKVMEIIPKRWGEFLRYQYATIDFTSIAKEGLYLIKYADSKTNVFRIASNIYDRGIWQPVLEYFLPVQMCHMMVREKYRIWHGDCHEDDATMAPVNFNHFDGYSQGPSTLTKYKSGEHVPGLNQGGWHDAGDYDLRIESQAGEVYILSQAFEEFNVNYDATSIDQAKHLVEIHEPDGKNDILQQIEHGLLSIIGAYESLGRLYRGIICRDLRQYVLLGDGSNMTDGIVSGDDRWVFTEDNPRREFEVAAELSHAYRSMKGYNDSLADKALSIARELYDITDSSQAKLSKIQAAIELYISTKEEKFKTYILANQNIIIDNFDYCGWLAVRVLDLLNDSAFTKAIRECAKESFARIKEKCNDNPYSVPYKPGPWGSGWNIQVFGAHYYYLHKALPDIYNEEPMTNALNFILGCHPGTNPASFASGVGAKSITTAYCANRADYSFIPGGVSSGTELINPNFPELLEFPYLWQQGEYVLGGGSSNYMFLVLAVANLYK